VRLPALAALLVGLAVSACGGDDPQQVASEARAVLARGDAASARSRVEAALLSGPPEADRRALEQVRLEACASLGDSAAVLEALAGQKAGADTYARLARLAGEARQLEAAARIADAGKQLFPDAAAPLDAVLADVVLRAQETEDNAALAALAQLGYLQLQRDLPAQPASTAPAATDQGAADP
jgi:hypothetical protein